jgi:hypothetical protein
MLTHYRALVIKAQVENYHPTESPTLANSRMYLNELIGTIEQPFSNPTVEKSFTQFAYRDEVQSYILANILADCAFALDVLKPSITADHARHERVIREATEIINTLSEFFKTTEGYATYYNDYISAV